MANDAEERLLSNSELVERIEANRKDPTRLVQRKRGSTN